MTVQTVPAYLQNASHSAAVFRQAVSAAFQSPGILGAGELAVSQQGTPNMSVILGAGRAMVAGSQVTPPSGLSFTTQAMYNTLNDGSITLTVTTANATNPRIDAVYIGVQDAFYSGSNNQAVAGIVAGTPASSPVAPSIPANSLLLAYIAVGAGVTSIVTANITQQALLAGLLGGYMFSPTLSALNAVTGGTHQHATVYADATAASNGDYVWNGTGWFALANDTGWITVASEYASGWSGNTTSPWSGIKYRLLNGITWIEGSANKGSYAAGETIFTLPSKFCPVTVAVITSYQSGGFYSLIYPTGKVTTVAAGSAQISIGGSFPAS